MDEEKKQHRRLYIMSWHVTAWRKDRRPDMPISWIENGSAIFASTPETSREHAEYWLRSWASAWSGLWIEELSVDYVGISGALKVTA